MCTVADQEEALPRWFLSLRAEGCRTPDLAQERTLPCLIRGVKHLTLPTPRSSCMLEQRKDNLDFGHNRRSTHVPAKRSVTACSFQRLEVSPDSSTKERKILYRRYHLWLRDPSTALSFGCSSHCVPLFTVRIAWVCPSRDTSLRMSVLSSKSIPHTKIRRKSLARHAFSTAASTSSCHLLLHLFASLEAGTVVQEAVRQANNCTVGASLA